MDASTNTNTNMALPGVGRQFSQNNYAAKCASAKLKEKLTECVQRLLCPGIWGGVMNPEKNVLPQKTL